MSQSVGDRGITLVR